MLLVVKALPPTYFFVKTCTNKIWVFQGHRITGCSCAGCPLATGIVPQPHGLTCFDHRRIFWSEDGHRLGAVVLTHYPPDACPADKYHIGISLMKLYTLHRRQCRSFKSPSHSCCTLDTPHSILQANDVPAENRTLHDCRRSRSIQLHLHSSSRTSRPPERRRARRIVSSFTKACRGVVGFREGGGKETPRFHLHVPRDQWVESSRGV